MPNYVAGVGCFEPKLMVIGDYPDKHDSLSGEAFSGPAGAMLNDYLYRAGSSRQDVYATYVVKYQPPFSDIKKLHLIGIDLQDCIRDLWEKEIDLHKPNCILAIGETALHAVTGFSGILNYRGSILTSRNGKTKVVPTLSSTQLYNRSNSEENKGGLDYVYTKLIQSDIARAVEESRTVELCLPHRELSVARNSLDLFRFFRDNESNTKAAVDIESINCIPVCVGFAFSPSCAISVPLLRTIGKVQLTEMSESEVDECWRLIDTELRRIQVIGHNFKYDDYKLGLMGFSIPHVYSDTLIKTRVLFPELPNKGLDTVASLWTREPYYKSEGQEFKLSDKEKKKQKFVLNESNLRDLFLYNAKDCAVTFEVDQEQEKDLLSMASHFNVPLHSYYYDYMMKKHKFYLQMENNGFAVDHDKKRELSKRYIQLQINAHAKLIKAIGAEINVKSYPQMYQLLYKTMGFKPYKKDPTSEDSIVKLLGSHCKGKDAAIKKEILEGILEERRIRDQRSRYINFSPDYDSRCKTSFNISATETCRSSTSVPKKPIRPRKMGLAFHTISKHGRLAKDIRSMFIPDKGKILLQADSSQAEARVVAVLSKDWELLKAFDEIDIHRRTAGLILGLTSQLVLTNTFIPVVDEIGKDAPERFCGKKTRHAGNYDMKKRRFMTEFNTDAQKFEINMTISEWKGGDMLEKFHAASPKIKNTFHADIQSAIQSTRTLIDPYGGVRIFNGRMDESLFQEAYANIPQRTVAHLVQGAAIKIAEELGDDCGPVGKANSSFISENHDSLLMQVPANNWEPYARLLKREMQQPIDFNTYCTLKRDVRLVIPADVEISETTYADLKKVKISDEASV